jgi:hypothetical protein
VVLATYFKSPLGCLIPLVILHILECGYIMHFHIYTDIYYLYFKLIENGCLVMLEILLCVVYAQAPVMSTNNFFALGYACDSFIIIMLFNAVIRLIYLFNLKISHFKEMRHKF